MMMNSYNVHMFQICCVNCKLYHPYPAAHHFTHHLISKYHGATLAQLEWDGHSCAVQEKIVLLADSKCEDVVVLHEYLFK